MAGAAQILDHDEFIGSVRAGSAANGFSMGRWVADPCGDRVHDHGHADAHFMLALSGAYVTEADGELSAGRAPFIYNPAGVAHRDRFVTPGWFFSVSIGAARLAEAEVAAELPAAPVVIDRPLPHALIRRLMAAGAGADPEPAVAESLCLELIGAMARPQTADRLPPAWLARAADALRDEPAREIRIDALARSVGVHPIHLARGFRRFMGCTPSGYLGAFRLERAPRLLSETRRPIAEVALDCGFADQSHFTRRFTRAYGVSPARFRRPLARAAGHV